MKRRQRCIGFSARHRCFKPCGKRQSELQSVELEADELEAIRLTDYEGLYQQECAERMQISRTTFSRTIESARRKIADALLNGKSINIKDNIHTKEPT
ncbi:MAG: DUF134 domain-containing protein [Campylobacterales bacterium]|jgi:predicted DNA-binding protein (UPF0251 family)